MGEPQSQMQAWKRLAHHAYYLGTLPLRRLNNARWSKEGRAPLMVLFYHRVADEHPNPWTMTNACFEWWTRL